MKDSKLVLTLCSVLALTACGGGSGGGGAPAASGGGSAISGGTTPFVSPRDAVSAETAQSNHEITNLSSEIVVASNSSSPVSTVRTPATVTSNGVTYTSFRLDDVKLFTAENLDNEGRSYINLEIDENGKIGAVKMRIGGQDSERIVRDTTDTTTFAGPIFEYVANGDDKALFRVVDNGQLTMADLHELETTNTLSGGHWNRVDERMVFATNGNGLQYSDFGHFNPVYRSKNLNLTTDDEIVAARNRTLHRNDDVDKYRSDEEFNAKLTSEDYQLFAGGYAISGTEILDTLTPQNSTSYSGKAVGRVYVSIQGGGEGRPAKLEEWNVPFDRDSDDNGTPDAYTNNAGHDMAKAYSTSHATMSIDNDGNQTLFMPFNTQSDDTNHTFYDVTITKAAGTNTVSVDFTGTPNDLQYANNPNPTPALTQGDFNPGYYGVNVASEAAGTARYYTEQDLGDGFTREWEVQAAYGMTKDE